MSQLREQLQSLKAEYETARYPGNLAEELLASAHSSRMRIFGWTAFASGIAAAIVFVLMHFTIVTQPSPIRPTAVAVKIPATTSPSENTAVIPVTNIAEAPSFPSDSSLVPSGESLVPSASSFDFGGMPSAPSLPSLDLNADNASTTKESV